MPVTPPPTVWASSHSVLGGNGRDESTNQVSSEEDSFIPGLCFTQSQNKYSHYEKAVEGCNIDFMLSWPVLIKETMAQTLYADMV